MVVKTSSKTSKDANQTNNNHTTVESRKSEIRYRTSDLKKMLNKFIASDVIKHYTETFKDALTGKDVDVEHNEVLFIKGKFIDKDTLQKIQFSMEADGIKDIEVSNQKRNGYEYPNESLYQYIAQVQMADDKKRKYLLLASPIENTIDIVRDYLELHSDGGFEILFAKKLDRCCILNDPRLYENVTVVENESDEPQYDDDGNEIKPDKEETVKFFQIDLNIKDQNDIALEAPGYDRTFICQTYSAEDSMDLIKKDLEKDEDERLERIKENSEKNNYEPSEDEMKRRHFTISTLKLGPLPVYDMKPRELSYEYNK